jgi:hypothetical protein
MGEEVACYSIEIALSYERLVTVKSRHLNKSLFTNSKE